MSAGVHTCARSFGNGSAEHGVMGCGDEEFVSRSLSCFLSLYLVYLGD